jgi:hypothetical protein
VKEGLGHARDAAEQMSNGGLYAFLRSTVAVAMCLLVLSCVMSGCLNPTNDLGRAYPITLPKSGQTVSYQKGDDGYYKKGAEWPNPRFTVGASGDATNCVTDNLTGLVWARNANMCGNMHWFKAVDYCNNLDYGGQTDWRLPNRSELLSLIDIGCFRPALSTGHPFIGVQPEYYWTSSMCEWEVLSFAWFVYLPTGHADNHSVISFNWVWPVRGGQSKSGGMNFLRQINNSELPIDKRLQTKRNTAVESKSLIEINRSMSGGLCPTNAPGHSCSAVVPRTGQTVSYKMGDDGDHKRGVSRPDPRFAVGASGDAMNCVTDNLTGLVWARNANMFGKMSWSNAIDYCNNLDYGGQTDWRLPNRSELLSLIDIGCFRPALSTGHPFIDVQSEYYWTSSTFKYYRDLAWFVSLRCGEAYEHDKMDLHYLWPVRSRQQ